MAPLPPLWPLIGQSDAATTPASQSMTAEGCCLSNLQGLVIILAITIDSVFSPAMRTDDVGVGIVTILPGQRKVSSAEGHSAIDAVFHS